MKKRQNILDFHACEYKQKLKVKIALSSVAVDGAKMNMQQKFLIGILKKCIKAI
jgi:hypothetical protein